jgi:hypothetical protein
LDQHFCALRVPAGLGAQTAAVSAKARLICPCARLYSRAVGSTLGPAHANGCHRIYCGVE